MTPALVMRRRAVNNLMLSLTGVCTVGVLGALLLILGYLFYNGASHLSWNFFTKLPTPVGESGGGMANAIVGSGKILLIATLIGAPIGFCGGVYLSEYGRGIFPSFVRYTADLLNGVPSIVIGIFAYALIVRPMHHYSAFAGGIALGMMMLPIALRTTEEFLRSVPQSLREGAMALGASKAKTIVTVVVPAALGGLISGLMLNLARVAGETAPLLFTSFNNRFWSDGFDKPIASLPVMIFNYAISPYEDWHTQAWAAGFVLLLLVLAINVTARTILARGQAKAARR